MTYFENKVAINIPHNLIHHDYTKNVEMDRHFIEEKGGRRQISTP